MRNSDIARLFLLAAIWGASFIFFRVLAPVLGPILTTNLRILIAGTVLCIYYLFTGLDCEWKANWKHYLIVGAINSALPFSLFCYAALWLPASYEVILNSTAPLFGVIFSWIWLNEKMNFAKIFGILMAALGVGLIVNIGSENFSGNFLSAFFACLLASACYAFAGIYIKKFANHIRPVSFAGCSQFIAGLALIPLTLTQPLPAEINKYIVLNILGLSLICSALAYLLYYQLISNVGPTKALTVTFLVPVFGMVWGALFLKEIISMRMVAGATLILFGTWFVVKKVKN